MISRAQLMERLIAIARTVRGGEYWVHRGPVNWVRFPWHAHKRAMALMLEERSLTGNQMETATLRIEAFAALPQRTDDPMIDDGLLDTLDTDVQWVVVELARAQLANRDSVALVNRASATVEEFFDPELGVQGIALRLPIQF